MQIIPLSPVPSQTLNVVLAGQSCQINVYVKLTGTFLDLYVNGQAILIGVLCMNFNRIVRRLYLEFIGDLLFMDTQGSTDPTYQGLGSRYVLCYVEASDLPSGVG